MTRKEFHNPFYQGWNVLLLKVIPRKKKLIFFKKITIPAKIRQFVEGTMGRKLIIFAKIKQKLSELDVPLLNDKGGIRELEAWAEEAILLENDTSLNQREKENQYLELKKTLEVDQPSAEERKTSLLEKKWNY